jgi:kynureninase
MALTKLMVELADAWLEPLGFALASPRRPADRGSHVALAHRDAGSIARALRDLVGVVPDFRAPDRLRFGPAPIASRFADVWEAMDRIRSLVGSGAHRNHPGSSRVT